MQRITPTHFIEVWKIGFSITNDLPLPIELLPTSLDITQTFGAETIAIFKIKIKDK